MQNLYLPYTFQFRVYEYLVEECYFREFAHQENKAVPMGGGGVGLLALDLILFMFVLKFRLSERSTPRYLVEDTLSMI